MMVENDTKQYSLEELKERHRQGKTKTQPDAPRYAVDSDFWVLAKVVMPPPGKVSVHLRLDSDVLEWFREQGKGHLSRMNAVLRSFMESQEARRSR